MDNEPSVFQRNGIPAILYLRPDRDLYFRKDFILFHSQLFFVKAHTCGNMYAKKYFNLNLMSQTPIVTIWKQWPYNDRKLNTTKSFCQSVGASYWIVYKTKRFNRTPANLWSSSHCCIYTCRHNHNTNQHRKQIFCTLPYTLLVALKCSLSCVGLQLCIRLLDQCNVIHVSFKGMYRQNICLHWQLKWSILPIVSEYEIAKKGFRFGFVESFVTRPHKTVIELTRRSIRLVFICQYALGYWNVVIIKNSIQFTTT